MLVEIKEKRHKLRTETNKEEEDKKKRWEGKRTILPWVHATVRWDCRSKLIGSILDLSGVH